MGLHLEPQQMQVVLFMLLTPMAANVVVLANQLEVSPDVAASTVLVSTCFALISVPLGLILL